MRKLETLHDRITLTFRDGNSRPAVTRHSNRTYPYAMRGMHIFTAAVLCVTSFLGAAAQGQDDLALPDDPTAVVVSLDSHDYWSDLARTNQDPLLSVRADGTVTVIHPRGWGGVFRLKLSKSELQDLLRFMIRDQDFLALNAADLSRAIDTLENKTGSRVIISDAGETVVHIRTADREHEVRFYASSFYAMRFPPSIYPELKSLGQLRAVESKLNRIMETLKAGGEKAVQDAWTEGNEYLKREYPQVMPFSVNDFSNTSLTPDGQSKTLSFGRSDTPGEFASVDVIYRQTEKTQFRFSDGKFPSGLFSPVLPQK
jgi:hypothetical protein